MTTSTATPVDTRTPLQVHAKASFIGLHAITVACHAVVNTVFTPPDPKPIWFDDLNAKLDVAKGHANHWINTLSVKVTKSVPTKIIDYGTTYSGLTQQINSIAAKHPTAKGKDDPYVIQIQDLVAALLTSVGGIITEMEQTSSELEQWGKDMQKSHDDLVTGAGSIQSDEADLQADIGKMNGAIKTLNEEIAGEQKAIAYAAGAIGLGLFALVAGIALAFVTFGAGLVIAGAGAAAIIGGAITWGVMQHKINKHFDDIAKDTKELSQDKRQMVALQGLAMAANGAISNIALATQALSDFRTAWGVFEGTLQGVQTKLQKAEDSIEVIVQEAFTNAAADEWAITVQFAEELVGGKVEQESKILPMSGQAA